MLTQKSGPLKLPEQSMARNLAVTPDKSIDKSFGDADLDSIMSSSAAVIQEERIKEQEAAGPGGLNLGETKSDKEFREMLEKVTGKKQDKAKNKLDKDDYLQLMVAQLQNQDPLKPMENQEMATQLANFNQVEQLVSINSLLSEMNKSNVASRSEKLPQYLGQSVQVNGDKIKVLNDRSVTKALFNIPSPASSANVLIKDRAGNTIKNITLNNISEGEHDVVWDGLDNTGARAPSGEYKFEIQASTGDGKPVPAQTSYVAQVRAVKDLSLGGKLVTDLGHVKFEEIVAVRASDEKAIKAIDDAQKTELAANETVTPKEEVPQPKPFPNVNDTTQITEPNNNDTRHNAHIA